MTIRCINADVFDALAAMASDSVDCVVTSPPYWGLRDYGTGAWEGGDPDCDHRSPSMRPGRDEARPLLAGSPATNAAQLLLYHRSHCGTCGAVRRDNQIGLEPTFKEHIEVLVRVFREVRRVLKPQGTLWLNYGDSYATSPNGKTHLTHDGRYKSKQDDRTHTDKPFSTIGDGLKRKDLSLMSARLAIALCDDGWWVRADNIWAKLNPKPESIKDRPTQAHEHVFLLTKSGRATIWRADDSRQWSTTPDLSERLPDPKEDDPLATKPRWQGYSYFYDADAVREPRKTPLRHRRNKHGRPGGNLEARDRPEDRYFHEEDRHLRNVWTIATEPYPGAHFATMPTVLAELCIRAGCPADGLVLDPFGGSGSTAVAADRLGRDAVLVDLSGTFCAMAKRRVASDRLKRKRGAMTDVAAAALPLTPIEAYIAGLAQ